MGGHGRAQGDAVAVRSSRNPSRSGKAKGQAETPAPTISEPDSGTVALQPSGEATAPEVAESTGDGAASPASGEEPAGAPAAPVAPPTSAVDRIDDFMAAVAAGGESAVRMQVTPTRTIRRAGRQWLAGERQEFAAGDIEAALLPAIAGEPSFVVEWTLRP